MTNGPVGSPYSSGWLGLGFLVLIMSGHQGMASFDFLIAIAFGTALLADFWLLPALLNLFRVRFFEGDLQSVRCPVFFAREECIWRVIVI